MKKELEYRLMTTLQRVLDKNGAEFINDVAGEFGDIGDGAQPHVFAFLVVCAEHVAGVNSMLRAEMLAWQADRVIRNDQRQRLLLEAMGIAKDRQHESVCASYERFALSYIEASIADGEQKRAGMLFCAVMDRLTQSPTIDDNHPARLWHDGSIHSPENIAALRAVGCVREADLLDKWGVKFRTERATFEQFIAAWPAFRRAWRRLGKCNAWKMAQAAV